MNRKRVQMLRDMIAGIPAEKVRLYEVFQGDACGNEKPIPAPCGAVACMAGWAWIYPPFVRAGIRRTSAGPDWPEDAAPVFFGTQVDNRKLFWARLDGESGTDKEVALKRLDRLLATGTEPHEASNA